MRMLRPELLLTFVTVAQTRSFTVAAKRLSVGVSTISQHVKQLEELLQRNLLARDTHAMTPTPAGDAFLEFARQILETNERMNRFITGSELRGKLRLGIGEDLVLSGPQNMLAEFAQEHPLVDLELTVALSGVLYERFDAGELDVVFCKRRLGDARGHTVWRERLVWIGRPGTLPDRDKPVSLLLYPPPSITRSLALEALKEADRSWQVTCTSSSLGGLHAAAHAGLGVTPHSARLIPHGLAPLGCAGGLPELGEIDFIVLGPGAQHKAASTLMTVILQNAGRLRASRS